MMGKKHNVIREVAWKDLFPWLNLFRVFRLAIGARVLFMGALAVLITGTGWSLLGLEWGPMSHGAGMAGVVRADQKECPWTMLRDSVPDRPTMGQGLPLIEENDAAYPFRHGDPITNVWNYLSLPALGSFTKVGDFGGLFRLVLCGLWGIAVWAFFGGVITRIAVMQLAAHERTSLAVAMRFSGQKFWSYFSAPLVPVIGIVLAGVPIVIAGLLMRTSFGMLLAGLVWPLFLILGLIMTLLLVGLLFGWPLMWPTISTEGSDSFDALSRSYAYVYQRPLHFLFYVVIASLFGYLCWFLVKNFAASVVWMTYWSATWGLGTDGSVLVGTSSIAGAGYSLIRFWVGCVKVLAVGFQFSYFWTAAVMIYLLLRRDVDATEMDEVFADNGEIDTSYGLPKVVIDEAGIPEVDENAPAVEADDVTKSEPGERAE